MKINNRIFATMMLMVFAATFLMANGNPTNTSPEDPYLKMIVEELSALEKKAVDLANEFPDDKYSWRPAEGIRSVSESFIHMAGANFWISSFGGMAVPESFPKDAEKTITTKAEVVATLKASFEQARNFVSSIKPEEFEDVIELPFGNRTKRQVCLLLAGHGHEHIGQLIAYARSTDVVPPWSKKEN